MERNELIWVLRRNLLLKLSLYEEAHAVDAREITDTKGKWWVGYSTKDFTPLGRETCFDLNVIKNICYLLHIQLEEKFRGRGFGWNLYEAIHAFSKDVGCKIVRQTPSGGPIIDGKRTESRRDYLLRRGYVPFGEHEVELRLQER